MGQGIVRNDDEAVSLAQGEPTVSRDTIVPDVLLDRYVITTDHGRIPGATTNAHYVEARNAKGEKQEFLIKGPSLASDSYHYVAANELICARIATAYGIPIQPHAIVEWGVERFFGSHYMRAGTYYPLARPELLDRCGNVDDLYDLIVFDVWVQNMDRNASNLPVRVRRKRATGGRSGPYVDYHEIIANDHSHCLMNPTTKTTPRELAANYTRPISLWMVTQIPYVLAVIQDPGRLRDSIDRAIAIQDEALRGIIEGVPIELLATSERSEVARFLLGRKAILHDLFTRNRDLFPQLGKGSL